MLRHVLRLAAAHALMLSLHVSVASAQEAPGDPQPTQEQVSLYQRAQQAYESGDYEATIALLKTANKIKAFDLFAYNIARAQFRLRRCEEAKEHYEQARLLPSLGPTLLNQIRDGLEELENVCEGRVELTCAVPERTTVKLDQEVPMACEAFVPKALKPGVHTFTVSLDDQLETIAFEVVGMATTTVETTLRPIPKPLSFASTTWGRRLSIAGGSLVLGALVLDQTLVRSRLNAYREANAGGFQTVDIFDRQRRLRRSQALALTMGTIGLIGASVGVPLWIRGHISEQRLELGLTMRF